MSEEFNYEEVFMGVTEGKPKSYLRTFKDDYRLKRLIEVIKLKKGKFLDIGSGGGILTESLTYYFPKSKIYGCDVSSAAISYGRKFGSGKVAYSVIKKKRLPYKDNTFDVCICLDVMEHIPDVDFFLKEVKRILKKNGQFFLLVPCEGQPVTFTWLFQKIKIGSNLTYKNWGHIHPEFTHKNVTQLLVDHGFNIQKKTYSEHIIYQLVNLFTYFLPKELMELFLGSRKASQYYDRGVVKGKAKGSKRLDSIMIARKIWLRLTKILGVITSFELELMKKSPLAAWKIHILAINKS